MKAKTKKKVPIQVERKDGELTIRVNVPITIKFKDTQANYKLLFVLLRLFCDVFGKPLCTFAQIADLMGLKERQNANNFWREFQNKGHDFLKYLERKMDFAQCIPLIENLVCENIILPIPELHRKFLATYGYKMSLPTFNKYLEQINPKLVLKVAQKLLYKSTGDCTNYQVLELIAKQTRAATVCDKILELKRDKSKKTAQISEMKSSMERQGLCFLVLFLMGCGLDYNTIALILNVSKSTVYNLAHEIRDLKSLIMNSIDKMSGKISIDEKYIRFGEGFVFVITIVDFVTGIPLYFDVYTRLNASSYAHCLKSFSAIYKIMPSLIVSDGSAALAAGIKKVFPKVRHQLCKFHKIKNLFKLITQHSKNKKVMMQLKQKTKKAFARKTVSGRKKAFRELILLLPKSAACYVENKILAQWDHLTGAFTSNASERYNRKIKKVTSNKYGLKSIDTINNLLLALWLKELITNGSYILRENSVLANLNISQICQENIAFMHLDQLFSTNIKKSA